jgi:hypothetical protein
MNAVDIAARGLARRALDTAAQSAEGAADMGARAEPSAAALEALAEDHSLLTGFAGATHVVEVPPYLTRDNLVIRGNGAELRNVSPRDVSDSDIVSVAFPVGSSNCVATGNLTYHAISTATSSCSVLDLGENAGNFAQGDLVILHGAKSYSISIQGAPQNIYREYLRARVVAVSGNYVTIDRVPSAELFADSPVIGNTAQGVDSGFGGDAPDAFYLLYNPQVANLRLASDMGEAWKWGGVIDGRFRDITIEGRAGVVFNALQDCLFDGIRFVGWRKIAEMAEGSAGTVYRNVRGVLLSNAGKFGGADDVPPFFIGFTENCRDCVMEDFNVSAGPNSATAEAVVLGSGRGNRLRNSKLSFPAHTNLGVLFSSSNVAGIDQYDCGIENCEITLPVCSSFLGIFPGSSGMTRPFVRDSQFFGNPSSGVAVQFGYVGNTLTGATLDNVRFEQGSLNFNGTVSDCVIRDCYIPDGFANLTPALLAANNIAENDSKANKAARGAALIAQAITTTSSTTANDVYAHADFPAGCLEPGDRIHVYIDAVSGDGTTKNARLSLTHGAGQVTTGIGGAVRASAASMSCESEIWIQGDTLVSFRTNWLGTIAETFISVGSIATYGLKVNVELWTANAASPIGVRCMRIIPVKPGMAHLPLR